MDAEYDEFGNFIGELPPDVDSASLPGEGAGDVDDAGWGEDEDGGARDGVLAIPGGEAR